MASRRAVTIGVEQFADPHEHLPFALELTAELGRALSALGYETTTLAQPELASASLGAAIRESLGAADAGGVLIVHALTHGSGADGGTSVYLLGSDGKHHPDADIGHWLATVHNVGDLPLTLFLLDFCQSGVLARLPWQLSANRPLRGWVIAASRGDRPAYDGRFTKAVVNVLRALAAGDLDIDPALTHIPLPTVAQAIHREVNRLAAADGSYPQQVTASLVDISDSMPEVPFFPNPAYRDDPRVRLRAEVDPGLLPFLDDLDEALDARHFVERAAGVGPLQGHDQRLTGCFTGRANELRRLSPWLNGEGDAALRVVTGSPGVGKSALLGVLICAAHPLLREQTRPLWERIAQFPLRLSHLAAVHARGRGVADVTNSLGRQLGLDAAVDAADLVSGIAGLQVRPVIVVDALDEAYDGVALMNELLLPLARATRENGTPAVRMLVGVRRYGEYAALIDAAMAGRALVDLDEVPATILEDDLYHYVTELLRTDPAYRVRGAVVGAFAAEVARVLSEQASRRREWGEFLVAGLYTRHVLTTHPAGITEPAEAQGLGARAPRTLPEVLELDLSTHSVGPLLRQVVTILARARGQGMPLTVITRLAATRTTTPTTEDVRQALQAARFYLRQHTDVDGTALYRLFHQGLADYLQRQPLPDLLAHLLAALGPETARDWQAAEPYLLRHALDHAAEAEESAAVLSDPGFLLQPNPAILLDVLEGKLGDVYRASLDETDDPARPPRVDRLLLTLNAVRAGMHDLAHAAATMPGEPALTWRPRWSFGVAGPISSPARVSDAIANAAVSTAPHPVDDRRAAHDHPTCPLAVGELHGRPIAATCSEAGTTVRVWDVETWRLVDEVVTGHHGGVTGIALGKLNEQSVVVTAGVDKTLRVSDLTPPTPVVIIWPLAGQHGHTSALALGELAGAPIAVTGGEDGAVRYWDLAGPRQGVAVSLGSHNGMVTRVALGQIDGRRVAVTGGRDGTIRVWDLARGRRVGEPMTVSSGAITALALGELGANPIAVSGSPDGVARLWDLITRRQLSASLAGHEGAITALAIGSLAGHPIAVTGGEDKTVRVWDLTNMRQLGASLKGHDSAIVELGLTVKDGDPIALFSCSDGTVQGWNLVNYRLLKEVRTGQPVLRPGSPSRLAAIPTVPAAAATLPGTTAQTAALARLTDHMPAVTSLGATTTGSRVLVVLGKGAGGASVVDLATREQLGSVADDGGAAITAIACAQIAGQPIAVLAREPDSARIVSLPGGGVISPGSISDPLLSAGPASAAALIVVEGSLLEVTGDERGAIAVQDGDSSYFLPALHDGAVTAVAASYLGDRPVAFTGGQDGVVMIWDLIEQRPLDVLAGFGPVFALWAGSGGDALLVGAGREVIAFAHAPSSGGRGFRIGRRSRSERRRTS